MYRSQGVATGVNSSAYGTCATCQHPVSRILVKNSTQVMSYGHCRNCDELYIQFWGGTLYRYQGVTEGEFITLRQAQSKGTWIQRNLKDTGKGYQNLGQWQGQLAAATQESAARSGA
jgi:hypothetical protein